MLSRPIFISGLRKSGTSMVRNLLEGHPELFVTPWNEVHFFKFTHLDHALMQIQGTEPAPIDAYVEQVCADRWFNPLPRLNEYGEQVAAPDAPVGDKDFARFRESMRARRDQVHDYPTLFEAMIRAMADATTYFRGDLDNARATCKGVQQTEFFPELLAWFPDIKFVYVLRNPYGQLNSAINNMRHNKQGLARKKAIGNDYRALDSKLPYPYLGRRLKDMKLSYFFARKFAYLHPRSFRILVYDRLLTHPEEEMRRLAEFLEIEFTPGLLELTQGGAPVVRSGWSVGQHADNAISAEGATAWKKQLPGQVIRLVNQYFGRVLDEFGFERVGSKASLWRRFDRSENAKVYIANRILFTATARQLLPR